MKKRLFKTILFGGSMGLCVVIGRWILEHIFNHKPFSDGYLADLTIGVSTFILLELVSEFKQNRIEK